MILVLIDAAMPPAPPDNFSSKHFWLLPCDAFILQSELNAIWVSNYLLLDTLWTLMSKVEENVVTASPFILSYVAFGAKLVCR